MAGMGWDLIGHTWAADMLRQHIAADRLRHAYLFSGPTGVGRRTLALNFARAINCPTPSAPGVPCGSCRTCTQIVRMQQPDLFCLYPKADADDLEVKDVRDLQYLFSFSLPIIPGGSLKADQVQNPQDAVCMAIAESLKIEQIREIQRPLALAPYESPYRLALLMRMEKATDSAQNALLKTLEEPNPRVILLLTADEPENLLPTIVSRCEVLRLRTQAPDQLADALITKKGLDADKANLIARVSGGKPGYAIRLAEDDYLMAKRGAWMADFLELLSGNKRIRLAYYDKKFPKSYGRYEVKFILRDGLTHWLSIWHDVWLTASENNSALSNPDFAGQVRAIATRVDEKTAARAVAALEHALQRLTGANLKLMVDHLLLDWPVVHLSM